MPRGVHLRTAARVQEARQMRDADISLRRIAEHFGCSPKTIQEWLADPDGAKRRESRKPRRGACRDCGGSISASESGNRERCQECSEIAEWPEDRILAAIRGWAERYGAPPREPDWDPSRMSRMRPTDADRARERLQAARDRGEAPSVGTVQARFITWAAAIEAAGFPPPGRRSGATWNDDRILAAITAWAEHYGSAPAQHDWNTERKRATARDTLGVDIPSPGAVAHHFGKWSLAIRAAGLQPRRRGQRRGLATASNTR